MACICRLPLFRLGCFERKPIVSSLFQQTQRGAFVKSDTTENYVKQRGIKDRFENTPQLGHFKAGVFQKKRADFDARINYYRIVDLCLPTEGSITNTVLRLHGVYERYKGIPGFLNEFDKFLRSANFSNLCKLIESNVSEFQPTSILLLYNLLDLGVPPTSPLMCKVSKELLNNFYNSNLIDKLDIYAKTKHLGISVKDLKEVMLLCEEYINVQFETDLHYEKYSYELLSSLNIQGLPRKIREQLAHRLAELLITHEADIKSSTHIIDKILYTEYDLLPRETWLNVFRTTIHGCLSSLLLIKLCRCYCTLVEFDSSFYCPELISLIKMKTTTCIKRNCHHKILLYCIKMGYLDKELLDSCVNTLITMLQCHNPNNCLSVLIAAEIITRLSYHETHQELNLANLLKELESYNFEEGWSTLDRPEKYYLLCKWCQCMTFLGCDTRNSLETIFQLPVKDIYNFNIGSNVLFLHHLARACLSDGYKPIDEASLDQLMRVHMLKSSLLDVANLNEYFGSEDYILKNCSTAKKHVLDFVAFFDKNNRPTPLSKVFGEAFKSIRFNENKIPSGFKVIGFQRFADPQPIKFINEPNMTSGVVKMYQKTFEDLDFGVVLLPNEYVRRTPEGKKNYLETEINRVLENYSANKK